MVAVAARALLDRWVLARRGPHSGKRVAVSGASSDDVRTMRAWALSKKEAGYKPAPTPKVECRDCRYMFPRLAKGTCHLVRGVIDGSYTCNEFEPRGHTKPPAAR